VKEKKEEEATSAKVKIGPIEWPRARVSFLRRPFHSAQKLVNTL
jgi:hypothetical protein